MKVQSDYETEQILAVFRTSVEAETAVQRLAAGNIHADEAHHSVLPPGRYDKADGTLGEGVAAVVRGAEIGAPAGAVLGLGAAAALLGGSSIEVMAGLAAGGAFVGGVLGALEGAVLRARFDDDVAAVHEVRDGIPEVLLSVQTAACDGSTARARRLLALAGALAFLDSTTLQLP
jgi:hypothetical protein